MSLSLGDRIRCGAGAAIASGRHWRALSEVRGSLDYFDLIGEAAEAGSEFQHEMVDSAVATA